MGKAAVEALNQYKIPDILERLDKLEARVSQLEVEKHDLKAEIAKLKEAK